MAYRVRMMPRAQRDLIGIYAAINAESSDQALAWYVGLKSGILSPRTSPNRCPSTPEDPRLRHWLYGHKPHVYRVIYRVLEKQKQVEVLHVRHGARRDFKILDVVP